MKIPQPPKLTGADTQRNAQWMDNWFEQIRTFYALSNVEENNKINYLKLWTEGDASTFLQGKLRANPNLTLDEVFRAIKQYYVPKNQENSLFKKQNQVHHIKDGKVRKITDVAIELDNIATQIGNSPPKIPGGPKEPRINDFYKIQTFVAAMHPAL